MGNCFFVPRKFNAARVRGNWFFSPPSMTRCCLNAVQMSICGTHAATLSPTRAMPVRPKSLFHRPVRPALFVLSRQPAFHWQGRCAATSGCGGVVFLKNWFDLSDGGKIAGGGAQKTSNLLAEFNSGLTSHNARQREFSPNSRWRWLSDKVRTFFGENPAV